MNKVKQNWLVVGIILLALILDQASKVYVKTHFELGETVDVFSWFKIRFLENNGMAFGIEWFSKLLLTLFRIVAVGVMSWYVHTMIHKQEVRTGYLVTIAMVMAGALGNIIDCVFYGKIWDYAGWFHGRVVDMLYFPLVEWNWPDWLPWIGGDHFIFFQPIFNVADAALSVGVILLILFYSKNFYQQEVDESKSDSESKK